MKIYLKHVVAVSLTIMAMHNAFGTSINNTPDVVQQSGSISGGDGCVGGTGTFTANGSALTTGYTWTMPTGITNTSSNPNAKTITVSFNTAGMGRTISVTGNGVNASTIVHVYSPIVGTGTLSGQSAVCAGQTGVTYSLTGLGNVQGYSWFATNGAVIATGQGTSGITVNYPSNYAGGMVGVTAIGGPCPAKSFTKNITIGGTLPGTPGTIEGASTVAPGQNGVSYIVDPISNTTSSGYQWSLPAGASIATGGGTRSITVNFNSSFTGGSITVKGSNSTCSGPSSSPLVLTSANMPSAAGTISGQSSICMGNSDVYVTYTVPVIANADTYHWGYGTGVVPMGDPNAGGYPFNRTMQFKFLAISNQSSFQISVYGKNDYGDGPPSFQTITVFKPVEAAGSISGPPLVCPGDNDVPYSVSAITNANPHVWVMPTGASISSGMNTNSIEIDFSPSFTGGDIRVFGVNGPCGSGASSILPVSRYAIPVTPGTITESTTACPGKAGVVYSVAAVAGVSYVWSVPPSATIAPPGNTNSITVSYASGQSAAGNVSVYATNCSGSGPTSAKAVTLTPLPAAAGVMAGSPAVCPGQVNVSYSVTPIAGASEYIWSLPSGATIASGQNTNNIFVNFSSSPLPVSGNISVYGKNCSGNGASSVLHVSINPLPGAAGTVTGNTLVCPGETGVVYNVPPIANASGYLWNVPTGATIVSGQGSNSITVDFNATAFTGNVNVRGTGCGINGTPSGLTINYSGVAGGGNVNHSVDLVTGTLSAGLPLFAVQDGDISVPVSLGYTATGVRVTDDDGWLGHNWSVSCQSYGIFRDMRGLPDDYKVTSHPDPGNPDNRVGWLNITQKTNIKNFTPATDNNPATCSDEVTNYNFLNGFSYNHDTEPDAFHVTLPGLSFTFYFDENNVPQVVPYQDVIITPNTTAGPIASFIVKDSKGVEYQFNQTESITEKMAETSPYYFVRRSNLHIRQFTYTTGWRLTKITSPTYGAVDFIYSTINTEDDDLTPSLRPMSGYFHRLELQYKYRFPLITSNVHGASGTMRYYRSSVLKLLDRITSPVMEAEFVSTLKPGGSLMKRLNYIKLYDKREGSLKLVKQVGLSYSLDAAQQRAFLTSVKLQKGCIEATYGFQYNSYPQLPPYNSPDKDEWGLYKIKNPNQGSDQYDETAAAGSLRKITHPLKGYTVFFYETHDYWDGTTTVQGGGIRVKKIILYDGVSSANDGVQEYSYKATNGNSSGKLQHKSALSFSVIKHPIWGIVTRYHQMQLQYPGFPESYTSDRFIITGDQDLSHSSLLNGSVVAYERVTVKTKDAGHSVFEYELPASYGETSANENEWNASKVLIARPPQGPNGCYQVHNLAEGFNRYPFAPNPNYDFARGQLKKTTDFNEAGVKVRDVVYDYQRIYGDNIAIKKVYGLALEELPTYYYTNPGYVDGKMFLYSKYEIFTNVKTELSKETVTIYNSPDLAKKTTLETNYYFDSPGHRELARTVRKNSDGTETVSRYKYVSDYTITSPANAESAALKALKDSHQTSVMVESTSSKIISGTEKYLGAGLTTFQTIGSKIYPHKQYSFVSNDGSDGFSPSSVTGSTTFTFDAGKYVLRKTYQNFDAYGNVIDIREGNKDLNAVAYGFNGTLPVISVAHASLDEIAYSDFETTTPADFSTSWPSPSYTTGRNNSKALNIPAGSEFSNILMNGVTCNRSPWYLLSFWIKAPVGGTLTALISAGSSASFPYTFSASGEWKYCTVRIPVSSIIGTSATFNIKIWSSVATQLDDVAFYPEHADFMAYTYKIPYGKVSETDSRGNFYLYDYDPWGRIEAMFDRDKNVIKKFDYQVKP